LRGRGNSTAGQLRNKEGNWVGGKNWGPKRRGEPLLLILLRGEKRK